MEVGALAFTYYVERVAGVDADGFIFRRVIDGILADEFETAVGIAAIETQFAFGQRDAEMVSAGIFEFLHYPDLGIRLRAVVGFVADLLWIVVGVLIGLGAVVDVDSLAVNAGGADEFDLLGLLVTQGGGALEGVEMEFVERLFADDRGHGGFVGGHFGGGVNAAADAALLDFVDISGQQFDGRILESLAALVAHSDPAHHVEQVELGSGLVGDHQVVIRLPAHAAADKGNLRKEFAGIVGLDFPAQRRLQNGISGEGRKERLAGQPEAQDTVDFDQWLTEAGLLISAVVTRAGDVSAANDPAANRFLLLAVLYQEVDGFAFVEGKQEFL